VNRLHVFALASSGVLGFFVGGWAYFSPRTFYDWFPGVLGSWVSVDGPFNEHLIRDVGGMYLALGATSVAGLIWLNDAVARVLGIAWSVFGALHLIYHAFNLQGLSVESAIGEMVALHVSLVLAILLLMPTRLRREPRRPVEPTPPARTSARG
jgi:hypothetical protein